MELHPRLDNIDVKGHTATVTLDEFHPASETTRAIWELQRDTDGLLNYTLRAGIEVLAAGTAENVRTALGTLTEATEEMLEASVVDRIQFAPDGLDNMGLWTALDSGLPVH